MDPRQSKPLTVQGATLLNHIYSEESFYGVPVHLPEGIFRRRDLQGIEDWLEGWRWGALPSKAPWNCSDALERSWSDLFFLNTVSPVFTQSRLAFTMGPSTKNLFLFWSLDEVADQSPVLSLNVSSIFPPFLNPKTPCPGHTAYCFPTASLSLEPPTAHLRSLVTAALCHRQISGVCCWVLF